MSIEMILNAISKMDSRTRRKQRESALRNLDHPLRDKDAQRILNKLADVENSEAAALAEQVRAMSLAQRVREAFTLVPMTETEKALVQVLLDNPRSSSEELTRHLGWHAQTWHLHFGLMCKAREARLWPAEPGSSRDGKFLSGILAVCEDDRWWTMKPEIAAGFELLGLRASNKAKSG